MIRVNPVVLLAIKRTFLKKSVINMRRSAFRYSLKYDG
ncbi:hypothetical protein CSC04_0143 [Enterobacter roggenkampii]|nr:hypothetical protein CSC04_0143 [Enterobacter roggenkampii]